MGFFVSCLNNARGTAKWATSSLVVTHGSTVKTWAFASRFTDLDATGYEVILDIVSYLNSEFSGTPSFSSTISVTGAGLGVRLTSSHTVTIAPSADLQAMFSWASSVTATSITTGRSSAVVGSYGGTIGVDSYIRHDTDDGIAGRLGAYSPGIAVTAHRMPVFFSVISEAQSVQISDIMAISSSPRRCNVYEEHTGAWRALTLGKVTVERLNLTHYRLSAEVVG